MFQPQQRKLCAVSKADQAGSLRTRGRRVTYPPSPTTLTLPASACTGSPTSRRRNKGPASTVVSPSRHRAAHVRAAVEHATAHTRVLTGTCALFRPQTRSRSDGAASSSSSPKHRSSGIARAVKSALFRTPSSLQLRLDVADEARCGSGSGCSTARSSARSWGKGGVLRSPHGSTSTLDGYLASMRRLHGRPQERREGQALTRSTSGEWAASLRGCGAATPDSEF